ncbi:MAG: ompA [Myxococcales bacterium]|nr:ompA [Myxococcales bacterium]
MRDPMGTMVVHAPRMRRILCVLVLAGCGGVQGGPTQSTQDVDGDGVPDVRDRCAYVAGSAELDGCVAPTDGVDRDGDGMLDAVDNCPDEPEDMDGFDDRDGCPELDNDRDGIADPKDGCPSEAEDRLGTRPADGCPDVQAAPADAGAGPATPTSVIDGGAAPTGAPIAN